MAGTFPLFTVDAFTETAFTGNPAAVCLLSKENELTDEAKQKLAAELNLPETAYVIKDPKQSFEKDDHFQLRWFTPVAEIGLCGHATVSAAAILFRIYGNPCLKLKFDILSGTVTAEKEGDLIVLDFPLRKCEEYTADENISKIVKATIGTLKYKCLLYNSTFKKLIIHLDDALTRADLESINPISQELLNADNSGRVNGVIVTLHGEIDNKQEENKRPRYDFFSRYFDPWFGDVEDPVTGSAHTILAPYWSKILKKTKLFARQCSKRGGDLWLEVKTNRVLIKGHAKIMIKGTLSL